MDNDDKDKDLAHNGLHSLNMGEVRHVRWLEMRNSYYVKITYWGVGGKGGSCSGVSNGAYSLPRLGFNFATQSVKKVADN